MSLQRKLREERNGFGEFSQVLFLEHTAANIRQCYYSGNYKKPPNVTITLTQIPRV